MPEKNDRPGVSGPQRGADRHASGNRPLMIAGVASGVGKTTVATGIMGAFSRLGLKVAPFKVGPDYIDPTFHARACGEPSRNLDTWLTGEDAVRRICARGSAGADVAVIEGVMGLFDGRAGTRGSGSSARIAALTGAAVVLVADCARQARSLAALLRGFASFDKQVDIAGVILNNVGSASHAAILEDAAREAGVRVLGVLPRNPAIRLPARHLGLVPAAERELGEVMEALIDHVAANIDLDELLRVAERPGVELQAGIELQPGMVDQPEAEKQPRVRIAVARDEAFTFFYVDSLEVLEQCGAELVFFSPLHDETLPECDGLFIGGGFPEVFAAPLEQNSSMRASVAAAAAGGIATYAECGGLAYLCGGLEIDGRRYAMAGALPLEARMTGSRQALGYVEAESRADSPLLEKGMRVRGHEFHWSAVEWDDINLAYDLLSTRDAMRRQPDGYATASLLATYVHIHFMGCPQAARRFVDTCVRSKGVSAGAV